MAIATSTESNTTSGYIDAEKFFLEGYDVENVRKVDGIAADYSSYCWVSDKTQPKQGEYYADSERKTFNRYSSKIAGKYNNRACAGLGLGEWEITLKDVGTFRGDSLCSSTPGQQPDARNRYVPGNPKDEKGVHCWCRVTSVPYSNLKTGIYVPPDSGYTTGNETHESCLRYCSRTCENTFESNMSGFGRNFRQAILGFYDK